MVHSRGGKLRLGSTGISSFASGGGEEKRIRADNLKTSGVISRGSIRAGEQTPQEEPSNTNAQGGESATLELDGVEIEDK
jgi:hypothetical protein